MISEVHKNSSYDFSVKILIYSRRLFREKTFCFFHKFIAVARFLSAYTNNEINKGKKSRNLYTISAVVGVQNLVELTTYSYAPHILQATSLNLLRLLVKYRIFFIYMF